MSSHAVVRRLRRWLSVPSPPEGLASSSLREWRLSQVEAGIIELRKLVLGLYATVIGAVLLSWLIG